MTVDLLALAAVLLAAAGLTVGRHRVRWQLAAGLVAGTLLVVDLRAWMQTLTTVLLGHAAVAAWPGWRGRPRSVRDALREAGAAAAPSMVLPIALAGVAMATGQLATFAESLAVAVPPGAPGWIAWTAAHVLLVVAVADGARPRATQRLLVGRLVVGASLALLVARLAWIASMAALPSEVAWSEGPFLVNALKLAAHQPLYGPPSQLDSYTYSPLVDLLHRALLAPVGLALSLRASRVLVVAEQLGAGLVLAWSVDAFRVRERRWAIAPLLLASFASLVAPAVHPDHGVMLCTAIGFALVVAEERWPRRLFWVALVAVTPIAVSFKLTGAGLGVGLAAVFLVERRWKEVGALALSGVLCVATIPLFDATLGRFSEYAIDLQRACPIVWSALIGLPTSPFGAAIGVAAAFALLVGRLDPASTGARSVRRAAILGAAVSAAGIPGFIKYCGRDNNLTPLLLSAVLLLVLVWVHHERSTGRRLAPVLGPLVAVSLVAWARPMESFPDRASRDRLSADLGAVDLAIREDAAAGRSTLPLLHAAAWIAAGRRDVPRDRMLSALELWLASRPEAGILLEDLDAARYDTVIAVGTQLRDDVDLRGEYDVRVRRALLGRYDLVYPPGRPDPISVPGALVFRRR